MLDQFLEVAYAHDTEKRAAAEQLKKLREFPVEVLKKLASADCDPHGSGAKSWLEGYRGSPLFDQALALERQDLQFEQQDQARQQANEANATASTQSWHARDAIKLKKRMLDLDLVLQEETSGGGDPEALEGQGVSMLEQAQTQEAAAGQGNEPHEQKENAAIADFRDAQASEKGPAPAKTAAAVNSAVMAGQLLAKLAKSSAEPSVSHFFGTPEEAHALADSEGREADREEAHPVRTRVSNGLGMALAGGLFGAALGSARGRRDALLHGALGAVAGGAVGASFAPGKSQRANSNAIKSHLNPARMRAESTELRAAGKNIDDNTGKFRVRRAILGGLAGSAAGLGGASGLGGSGKMKALSALGGGLAGAGLAALPKPSGNSFRESADAIDKHLAKHKHAAANEVSAPAPAPSDSPFPTYGQHVLHSVGQRVKGALGGGVLGAALGAGVGAYASAPGNRAVAAFKGAKAFGLTGAGAGATLGADKAGYDTALAASKHKTASVGSALKRGTELLSGSKARALTRDAVGKVHDVGAAFGEARGVAKAIPTDALADGFKDVAHAWIPGAKSSLQAARSERGQVAHARGIAAAGAAGAAGLGLGSAALAHRGGQGAAVKEAGIGGVISGAVDAAKGLGGLARTAYKAGGLGQVAKSVGTVAGGFAKANPLATAGLAAAGGIAAGRLSKRSAPPQPQY